MKKSFVASRGLVLLAGLPLVTPLFGVVAIDWAFIGNPGNVADPATGNLFGAVDHAYQISRNETSISQYAEFLNAVAKADPYGLYSLSMSSSGSAPYVAGINRSGSSGSYLYSVVAGRGNQPITSTNWFDAARFCNWLHNGQGSGSTETGAYTLNGATSGIILKQAAAKVWIPTENEWYKAAYYDPGKGGTGGYWPYAVQSDTLAGNTIGVANSANYHDGDYVGYPGPALTDCGAYGANSDSFYGTNDQTGNVFEWNDAVSGSFRGLSGGAWINGESIQRSSLRNYGAPTDAGNIIGFRVATVPEPTALILTILAGGSLLCRRQRRES